MARRLHDNRAGTSAGYSMKFIWSANRLMKRVIVQILPAEASSSENPSDPSAEFRARQEVIPITGDDERADVRGGAWPRAAEPFRGRQTPLLSILDQSNLTIFHAYMA